MHVQIAAVFLKMLFLGHAAFSANVSVPVAHDGLNVNDIGMSLNYFRGHLPRFARNSSIAQSTS
jgi:hypothetical protein